MKKEDIINLIKKELEVHPQMKSVDFYKKYRIPIPIVEFFRRSIEKN
ncbi:hypothetical protein BGM26_06535 [Bacillus sp. FJAT-29790]|nr:hypothetical protein [Bacillus sp. FJAT-29790]MBU8878645.1 hypothetical protein [Bacillus sp. FJAT-29790]